MNYKEYEKLARAEADFSVYRRTAVMQLNAWVSEWFYSDTKYRLFKALHEHKSEVFVRGYNRRLEEMFIGGHGMPYSEAEQCVIDMALEGVNRACVDFMVSGCRLGSPDEWDWTSGQPTMTIKLVRPTKAVNRHKGTAGKVKEKNRDQT